MSIRSHGKSWEITIDIGFDGNGKRTRRFETVRGTKKEAEKRERELLADLDKGIIPAKHNYTIQEWLTKWLSEYVKPTLRPRTYDKYEGSLKSHVIPYIGKIRLMRLSPADVRDMESALRSAGVSIFQVEYAHIVLSGALKAAMQAELIFRNVCKNVKVPYPPKKALAIPEVSAVQEILAYSEDTEDWLFPCLRLIAYTGMRRGEAIGLCWRDLDLEKGVLRVNQALSRAKEGLIFQKPKTTSGERSIELDSETIGILRSHRAAQNAFKLQVGTYWQDQNLVFPSENGSPMNPARMSRDIQRIQLTLGLAHVKLHDLRHFHASLLLQSGENPVLVSKRLGHANVSTTLDIYANVLPVWQKKAAENFATAMKRSG